MTSDLIHIGIVLIILAVVAFAIYGIVTRVPADRDTTDIGWASAAKRKILLEERIGKQRMLQEVVHLPSEDADGGTPATKARAVARQLPRPVTRVRQSGYWVEDKAGRLVGTAKALAIEQWALAALA